MTWAPIPKTFIERTLERVTFNKDGLISAIAQDTDRHILMLAWMNREALAETLTTGRVCYYSRSRHSLWRKGETSGQEQHLLSADFDCDMDAILLTIQQKGVACHTGRRSCFYQRMTPEGLIENSAPDISPEELYRSKG